MWYTIHIIKSYLGSWKNPHIAKGIISYPVILEGFLKMYKLMIVDDEENIRFGLSTAYGWEKLGFSVSYLAKNGYDAIEYLQKHPVDVILSDIKMPILDGLELAAFLQSNYPEILLVLLSGFAEFEYAQKALRYGVKDYLLKPIQYDNLLDTFQKIQDHLNEKRGLKKIDDLAPGYYEQIIESVLRYIETDYKNATLEKAALQVSISPNYLSRIFKKKRNINFCDYLLNRKMEKAAELLQDISKKIYEVADEVGYDNPKNFSRAFKQYTGKTPLEFREKDMKP